MSFSLDDIFGEAKKAVENGLEQVKTVGIPALQNAGEQWAANVLKDQANQLLNQNKETQKKLNEGVSQILNAPSNPNSFGHFLSEGIQGSVLSEKGLTITLAVIGIGVLGFILLKK